MKSSPSQQSKLAHYLDKGRLVMDPVATVHPIKQPPGFDPSHETLSVPQFAQRIHRSRRTAYHWIKTGQMPPKTVLIVQGHYEIDWTEYSKSVRVLG